MAKQPERSTSEKRAFARDAALRREMSVVRLTLLHTLVHELGNSAAPMVLVAEALAIAPSPERSSAAARTVHRVASRLSDLTMIARIIATDGNGIDCISPDTDGASWATAFKPFVEALLPDDLTLQAEVDELRIPGLILPVVVWSIALCARYLGAMIPEAANATLCVRHQRDARALRVELSCTGTRRPDRRAARLPSFARVLAHTAGGELRVRSVGDETRCTLSVPLGSSLPTIAAVTSSAH